MSRFRDELEKHPVLAFWLAGVSLIATLLFGFYFYTIHTTDQKNADSDKRARDAATAILQPRVCELVYVYVHPPGGTPVSERSAQVIAAWSHIGELTGCPNGTAPKS